MCICPTYRRAWDTVMPSYFKVFPKTMGDFHGSRGDPAEHSFEVVMNIDGGPARVYVEVWFRAVNDLTAEELADFFRGLECTAFWLPEADTNADLDVILSLAHNRAGRYPEPEDRPENMPAAYKGVFGDANAPLMQTPFYRRFYGKTMVDGASAPATDECWRQPGGRSVNAENMANLRKIDPDFYDKMAAGQDAYDNRRLIDNKPGFGRSGQPVHPNFDEDRHVAAVEIAVDPHSMLIVSVDAGSGSLRPGATFEQRRYSGQWCYLDEIFVRQAEQMTTPQLGEAIREKLESPRFAEVVHKQGAVICIDPAAISRSPQTEYTDAQALQAAAGIEVILAPTNKADLRRNALNKLFLASVPGSPRDSMIVIDRRCTGLIQALSGAWHYPKRGGVVSPNAIKNEYANVGEAAEYGPLTIDGLDASEGRFIRPGAAGAHDTVSSIDAY